MEKRMPILHPATSRCDNKDGTFSLKHKLSLKVSLLSEKVCTHFIDER